MTMNDTACRLASMIGRYAQFRVEDQVLRWKAPKGTLTEADREWIDQNRANIIVLLTIPAASIHEHIWWSDGYRDARLLWIPTEGECHAPRACSRLGPCQWHCSGRPCDQSLAGVDALREAA